MTVEEFFNKDIKEIEEFDFTNEVLAHKIIHNRELKETYLKEDIDPFKKYIIYKTELTKSDPDTNIGLLKDIYKMLWDEKYLNACERKSKLEASDYYSDTMTSAQGLLSHFYVLVYNEESNGKKIERCTIGDMYEMYQDPKSYPIFNKYFIADNAESNIIKNFLKYYHTLGNYIPVPKGFNMARSGFMASHDMWDLTLEKIKKYYEEDAIVGPSSMSSSILELFHVKDAYIKTQKWLNEFGSWENFVKQNYLLKQNGHDNYVNEDLTIDTEFTSIHNFDNPVISTKEDCLNYFKKLTDVIIGRTNIIKEAYDTSGK